MITVYSQPGCPMCEVLKGELSRKKIPFTAETNVDTLVSKGITHVPMLETDEGDLLNMQQAMRFIKTLGQ